MLVQFTIKNYKSFEEETTISFVASTHLGEADENNTIYVPQYDLRLLKTAVIYGANASGKSKLFEGMAFMRKFIQSSSKEGQVSERIPVDSFRLNTETIQQPSMFEVQFIHNNELYRYGFEATKDKIIAEWLYYRPKTKEIELFYREEQTFSHHATKFKVDDLINKDRVRPNALLLSVAANWNDKIAEDIVNWFSEKFIVISGLKENNYIGYSIGCLQEENKKAEILRFMENADLGIDDLKPEIVNIDDLPQKLRDKFLNAKSEPSNIFSDVITFRKLYNTEKEHVSSTAFSMDDDESAGTRKYFALSGPILSALELGQSIVIDELDAKLHPLLTQKLVGLFNNKEINPKNAQLLFNTHDSSLLSKNMFRRDQIWFTEKNRYGASTLYSLSDIKGVRKEENHEKNYIEGKYGAIPFLGDFDNLFNA